MKSNFKLPESITNIFASFFVKDEGDYTNAVRDWTLGLFIAVLLFFIGVLFIALDFYSQFGVVAEFTAQDTKTETYRDKEVKMFAEEYSEKQKTFNELRAEVVAPTPEVLTPVTVEPEPQPAEEATPSAEQTVDVPLAVDD